jgi:hypothetical protein
MLFSEFHLPNWRELQFQVEVLFGSEATPSYIDLTHNKGRKG